MKLQQPLHSAWMVRALKADHVFVDVRQSRPSLAVDETLAGSSQVMCRLFAGAPIFDIDPSLSTGKSHCILALQEVDGPDQIPGKRKPPQACDSAGAPDKMKL
jgi:hypothetical protein